MSTERVTVSGDLLPGGVVVLPGTWSPEQVQLFRDAVDIGTAWQEAEAELDGSTADLSIGSNKAGTEYFAVASDLDDDGETIGSGATPAEALRNLVGKLREPVPA